MMVNGFITWDMLKDYGTFVMIVFMLVQVIKELPKLKNIPTRIVSICISFILTVCVNFKFSKFDFIDIVIYLVSAVLISFTANGMADGTIMIKEKLDNSNKGGNENGN